MQNLLLGLLFVALLPVLVLGIKYKTWWRRSLKNRMIGLVIELSIIAVIFLGYMAVTSIYHITHKEIKQPTKQHQVIKKDEEQTEDTQEQEPEDYDTSEEDDEEQYELDQNLFEESDYQNLESYNRQLEKELNNNIGPGYVDIEFDKNSNTETINIHSIYTVDEYEYEYGITIQDAIMDFGSIKEIEDDIAQNAMPVTLQVQFYDNDGVLCGTIDDEGIHI